MLPIGSLRPAAGWGEPRENWLSHDEPRTLLTLWSIFRSPLIMGGNLTQSDPWATSLLTNSEVIAVDQHSRDNRPVITNDNIIVWTARPESGMDSYVQSLTSARQHKSLRFRGRISALRQPTTGCATFGKGATWVLQKYSKQPSDHTGRYFIGWFPIQSEFPTIVAA